MHPGLRLPAFENEACDALLDAQCAPQRRRWVAVSLADDPILSPPTIVPSRRPFSEDDGSGGGARSGDLRLNRTPRSVRRG